MPACMYIVLQLQIVASALHIKLELIHVCVSALLIESLAIGFTFSILYMYKLIVKYYSTPVQLCSLTRT